MADPDLEEGICGCGHVRSTHKWVPGFYDVRGHYGECTRVGCGCKRYFNVL